MEHQHDASVKNRAPPLVADTDGLVEFPIILVFRPKLSDTTRDLVRVSLSGGIGAHRMLLSQSLCKVGTNCGLISLRTWT